MTAKHLDKYLLNYAEIETASLASFPQHIGIDHVVVIPAYKETVEFIDSFLDSALASQNSLMIVVINQPQSCQNAAINKQQRLFEQIHLLAAPIWQQDNLYLLKPANKNTHILVVDRFTIPINDKQGVGLARKIGTDLALALKAKGNICSDWICSTDADASLPDNYFSTLSNVNRNAVAACYDFTHVSDDKDIEQANRLYETGLRYYVKGLQYAGSSYAFFTIGSTIAITASAYAMVRGFPKRSAGEDFYLLNKVAKLGDIAFIDDCQLSIQARTSDRVPFGTGPAVSQIMALIKDNKPYCYYHPHLFQLLKLCLSEFTMLYQHKNNSETWFNDLPTDICAALKTVGFDTFINKNIHHSEQQFNKQLLVWFDAFKTLKFLHALRDLNYPNMPINQALAQADFSLEIDSSHY
ncbi:hypothetical protein [Thalassotalea sp. PLHSN55]|uniref:hypothetical protein n=1 Tax=Thalassotalea sp. PLHSN55 TaxID=3435888 RepID=UPI003F84F055